MVHGPGFPANKPRPTAHNGDRMVYMAWGNLSSADIDIIPHGGGRWIRFGRHTREMCNILPVTITAATRRHGHNYGGVVEAMEPI
jgi:hypothetical protein